MPVKQYIVAGEVPVAFSTVVTVEGQPSGLHPIWEALVRQLSLLSAGAPGMEIQPSRLDIDIHAVKQVLDTDEDEEEEG